MTMKDLNDLIRKSDKETAKILRSIYKLGYEHGGRKMFQDIKEGYPQGTYYNREIEALKICSRTNPELCKDCPYYGHNCVEKLMRDCLKGLKAYSMHLSMNK